MVEAKWTPRCQAHARTHTHSLSLSPETIAWPQNRHWVTVHAYISFLFLSCFLLKKKKQNAFFSHSPKALVPPTGCVKMGPGTKIHTCFRMNPLGLCSVGLSRFHWQLLQEQGRGALWPSGPSPPDVVKYLDWSPASASTDVCWLGCCHTTGG